MDLARSPLPAAPPPGPLAVVLGAVRVGAVFVLIVVGAAVLLLAALVPVTVGGARPALWVAVGLSRLFVVATGVRLRVDDAEALRRHRGFVFFNHLSFLDVVVLLAARPVRFLAASGVRRIPFVGPMATAAGTLYVRRGDDASRQAAREDLVAAFRESPTPVALAPEGKIGPGPGVLPLRHGAFETAHEAGAPVLLVALRYTPHALAEWHPGEWLLTPLWRLCARRGPFRADVTALPPPLDPTAAPAAALAAEAAGRLDAALGVEERSGTRRQGGTVTADA